MPSKPIKEVPADLPDFFIAFVLPGASRPPTSEEIEAIRHQTVEFWTKQLVNEFSKPFLRLELNVTRSLFGERLAEEKRGLGDEFNMYLEMSGRAIFNGKFRGLPSGDDIFREMVAGDSMDYLVAFVRGLETANLFATALEVTARRVKPIAGAPGGTVVVPSFFVAFSLDQEDPEAAIPDGVLPDKLVEEWRKRTHKAMEDNLRKEWPDTFESLNLETTLADKGNKKPDDRFHVYMENEAAAKFSSDPPSPEDVFRVLMKSASTDSTVYLLSLHDMDGTPFSCVEMVTIQLVGMEMPKPEELPPLEEQEKKEESGDEGDPDGEEEQGETSDYIQMNLPVFLALVLNTEPPAEMPSNQELLKFKDLMLRFFYTTVKKEYPQIKNMELRETETKFGAGQPEARYNMCVEYDARLQFKDGDDIPEKEAIQKMIMEVNLSSILAHVKNLEPLCFKFATEVTMRQKSREKADAPVKPDSAFEAAVEAPLLLPLPPQVVNEAPKEDEPAPPVEKSGKVKAKKKPAKKKKPKATPPEETQAKVDEVPPTNPQLESEPQLQPEPVPVLEPEPEPQSEPEPEPQSEPVPVKKEQVKRKKQAKVSKPKSLEPPMSPAPRKASAPNKASVQSSDIYCAMKLNKLSGMPSDEQLDTFLKNVCGYFKKQLKKHYPTRFADLELTYADRICGEDEVLKKIGKQQVDGMNFYAEFVTSASFHESDSPSSPVKKVTGSSQQNVVTAGLPTPYELTRAIVRDCDVIKFLLEHVRIISGSDFTSATVGLLQQRIEGRDK